MANFGVQKAKCHFCEVGSDTIVKYCLYIDLFDDHCYNLCLIFFFCTFYDILILPLKANGRFEVGKKICLSISGHHPETWQPSWSSK